MKILSFFIGLLIFSSCSKNNSGITASEKTAPILSESMITYDGSASGSVFDMGVIHSDSPLIKDFILMNKTSSDILLNFDDLNSKINSTTRFAINKNECGIQLKTGKSCKITIQMNSVSNEAYDSISSQIVVNSQSESGSITLIGDRNLSVVSQDSLTRYLKSDAIMPTLVVPYQGSVVKRINLYGIERTISAMQITPPVDGIISANTCVGGLKPNRSCHFDLQFNHSIDPLKANYVTNILVKNNDSFINPDGEIIPISITNKSQASKNNQINLNKLGEISSTFSGSQRIYIQNSGDSSSDISSIIVPLPLKISANTCISTLKVGKTCYLDLVVDAGLAAHVKTIKEQVLVNNQSIDISIGSSSSTTCDPGFTTLRTDTGIQCVSNSSNNSTKALFHFNGNSNNSAGQQALVTRGNPSFVTGKFSQGASGFSWSNGYNWVDQIFSDIGTGDFTVDFWANFASIHGRATLVSLATSAVSNPYDLIIQQYYDGLYISVYGNQVDNAAMIALPMIYDGQMHHIAVERSGLSVYVFIDGIERGAYPLQPSWSFRSGLNLSIGTDNSSGNEFYGVIDELRFSNKAMYDKSFIPKSVEYTGDSTIDNPEYCPIGMSPNTNRSGTCVLDQQKVSVSIKTQLNGIDSTLPLTNGITKYQITPFLANQNNAFSEYLYDLNGQMYWGYTTSNQLINSPLIDLFKGNSFYIGMPTNSPIYKLKDCSVDGLNSHGMPYVYDCGKIIDLGNATTINMNFTEKSANVYVSMVRAINPLTGVRYTDIELPKLAMQGIDSISPFQVLHGQYFDMDFYNQGQLEGELGDGSVENNNPEFPFNSKIFAYNFTKSFVIKQSFHPASPIEHVSWRVYDPSWGWQASGSVTIDIDPVDSGIATFNPNNWLDSFVVEEVVKPKDCSMQNALTFGITSLDNVLEVEGLATTGCTVKSCSGSHMISADLKSCL